MSRSCKANESEAVFSLDTSVLADLWNQFINNTCIDFDNEITTELQDNLFLHIIKEGIRQVVVVGDDEVSAFKRYRSGSPCLFFAHEIHLYDKTVIPLSNEFIQSVYKPIRVKLYNEYVINKRKLAEDFNGHEFETIRIAVFIKNKATKIDSEKFKKCLNGDNNGTKVFLIEGAYYGIDDFDPVFMSKGEYVTEEELEIERSEFEKVLNCPFDELPLFMNSGYATAQYVIRGRFLGGR